MKPISWLFVVSLLIVTRLLRDFWFVRNHVNLFQVLEVYISVQPVQFDREGQLRLVKYILNEEIIVNQLSALDEWKQN